MKPDAATVLVLGTVAAWLGVDYWLVKSERRSITKWLYDNDRAVEVAKVVLDLHAHNQLGRFDPFLLLGKVFLPTNKGVATCE